ncbi:hypothetical protein GCM10022223_60870 [Kineosporia mesophila]|uniref:Immunity protein 35 of polymorphic toxin system n=1 Tax=Kineosporia mesophila TaxID=566012 RepID=A0ABP7AK31_9ACTN|nr:hypothetical protein [Kineosporia mesophila]MCD5355047.1 hypothetical protein [Kineosporia mesophila]
MDVYELAAGLPETEVLRARCRALALLDRILAGENGYHHYVPAWGDDQAMTMDNNGGDEWTIVFTGAGCFIRIFDHESPMTPWRDEDLELWPGLADGLPEVFRGQLDEPAFSTEDGGYVATALLWRQDGDDRWSAGPDLTFPEASGAYQKSPDGASMLDVLLDDMAVRYVELARENYEVDLGAGDVQPIVSGRPLTDALVLALNPEADLDDVRTYASGIGYPV